MSNKLQNFQMEQSGALAVIGAPAGTDNETLFGQVNKHLDVPVRLYAAATPDSKLYFAASLVEVGDGAAKVLPPIDGTMVRSNAGTLDYQAITSMVGGLGFTLTKEGAAYTHPVAASIGQFIAGCFVRKADGSIDCKYSDLQSSLSNLLTTVDFGPIFTSLDGLPIGIVFLESTDTSGRWKTAGAATSVIQNKVGSNQLIWRFGAGSGGGGNVAVRAVESNSVQLTSALASNTINHGLSGEPHLVQVFYYDGTKKYQLNPEGYVLDKTSTQIFVSTLGLTFGGSQYVEVQFFFNPSVTSVAGPSTAVRTPWYSSAGPNTYPHGFFSAEDVRGYAIQERDTVTGRRRNLPDAGALVTGFDDTYFYLDWTSLPFTAPNSNPLEYRLVSGGAPLPWAIPEGLDSITDRDGTGAPNFPNGATGITTGINGSPIVYKLTKQAIGALGTAGQRKAGHKLSAKSWPAAMAASKMSWYNLDVDDGATLLDDSGNGRGLTKGGSLAFTATDLWGNTNAAANYDGSDDSLLSTNAFFNPGPAKSFAFGAWFALSDWTPSSSRTLFQIGDNTADRTFVLNISSAGSIDYAISYAGSSGASYDADLGLEYAPEFADGERHHIAVTYDSTTETFSLYVDGKWVQSANVPGGMRAATSAAFQVGRSRIGGAPSGTSIDGPVQDLFFVNDYALSAEDVHKLYSYRLDHATGVAVGNQRWSANFYGDQADQDDTSWIVDKYDTNTLFLDFDRAAADQVELFMEDRSLSPTTVGSVAPYDVIHSSNPTFPLAHGQAGAPELVVYGELSTGVWSPPLSAVGAVTADSTNIDGSLASFFTAGYLRVRLVARNVGPVQTGVPAATTGLDGLITARAKGHQKMGGLKGFLDGAYTIGNVRASAGGGTIALSDDDNRHQVFNLTADTAVTLPSVSVAKGDRWVLINRSSSFVLTVKSSAGDTLDTLLQGRSVLRALQDVPTSSAHWYVEIERLAVPGVAAGLLSLNGPKGRTDGNAVPAGYMGEMATASCSAASTTSVANTPIDVTGMSLTLQPGTYVIGFDVSAQIAVTTAATIVSGTVYITDAANNYVTGTAKGISYKSANAGDSMVCGVSSRAPLVVTTTTTYKVRATCGSAAAAGTLRINPGNFDASVSLNPDNDSILWVQRVG